MPYAIRKRWPLALLVAITALAAFLRLYQLDITPPGFHYDEAFNAIQARDVLRGVNRPIFFTGNFGEEPMQMYVEAAVFALGGMSPFSARLSNVFLGLLLIPALYFAGRALTSYSRTVSLIASFIGATLYWAINFSRLGLETNSLPWVLTLSAGAIFLAHSRNDRRWAIAAGLLLGACLYTYLASRVWPVAVALWFLYLGVWHRATLRGRLGTWVLLAVAAAIAIAPLALFFALNPLALTARSGQVLTLDQLATNLLRSAGMFVVAGDIDPRNNLPGRAALDPFLAVLFIAGLLRCLRRWKEPAFAFLLIWIVVMTAPSALTEFAPNLRRSIGAMPAVALVCGVGAEWLIALVNRSLATRSLTFSPQPLVISLLSLGLATSAYSSANAYLSDWASGTGLYYSFDAGLYRVGQLLAARPASEQLCLSPDYHEHPTVLWSLDGRAFSTFDGRRATVLPNSALPATCAIITFEDPTDSLRQYYPDAQRLVALSDREGRPYAEVLHIPAGTLPHLDPQHPLEARVGNAIRVLGYDLRREGDRLGVRIYWRSTALLAADYTVFVHLLGPTNRATDSPVWDQDDAQPGHGAYPTNRWRAGETIVDDYSLKLPSPSPEGKLFVEVGMYLLATGERLPVYLEDQRVPDDRLLLGLDR